MHDGNARLGIRPVSAIRNEIDEKMVWRRRWLNPWRVISSFRRKSRVLRKTILNSLLMEQFRFGRTFADFTRNGRLSVEVQYFSFPTGILWYFSSNRVARYFHRILLCISRIFDSSIVFVRWLATSSEHRLVSCCQDYILFLLPCIWLLYFVSLNDANRRTDTPCVCTTVTGTRFAYKVFTCHLGALFREQLQLRALKVGSGESVLGCLYPAFAGQVSEEPS